MDVALHISCGMMGQGLQRLNSGNTIKKGLSGKTLRQQALLHIRYPPVVGEVWPPWRRAERLRMERWLLHSHD